MNITPYSRARYDKLAQGWNTWNVRSVASHVYLPDNLSLSISLYPDESEAVCREFVWEQVDRFGEHAADGSYTDITLTLGEVRIRVETCSEGATLGIKVSPLFVKPGTRIGLDASYLWGRSGEIRVNGNCIRAHTTTGHFTVESSIPSLQPNPSTAEVNGLCLPLGRLPLYIGVNRPADSTSIDRDLEHSLHKWMERTIHSDGALGDGIEAMRRVLAWNMSYEPLQRRVITPVSRGWCRNADSFGHYVLFGWDTFFASLMWGMLDKDLAYATLSSILEEILPSGNIPNFGSATGSSQDRSEPQVGSWCAMKLYRQFGDKEFLEECFDRLLAWNRWRFSTRDRNGDGLLELASDPYTPDDPNEQWHKREVGGKQGAMWESGLDNHPMWDAAVFNAEKHCMELTYAGENGLMVADCQVLADMAAILGRSTEETELRNRADNLARRVNDHLWSNEHRSYLNKDWAGQFNPVMGLPHFYPLLAGIVSDERKTHMLKRLVDPDEFGGELVIPNVGRREPSFKDQNYWRGRIWGPTNFLVSEGVRRSAAHDIAHDLASKSLSLIVNNWKKKNRVCENYNAITGEGSENGGGGSDPFYTWGGLLAYMALQESFDPLAWTDGISMGPHIQGTTHVHNVPFRNQLLTLDGRSARAKGATLAQWEANTTHTMTPDSIH